jgi:hypothetical protein
MAEPFYPLHSIETGKYTPGGEYVVANKPHIDYIGLYHVLPNDQLWTGSTPTLNSEKLVPKRLDASDDVKRYDSIKQRDQSNYISPISYYPQPTFEEYRVGKIFRYFVQKRNNPYTTIQEIDAPQYISINRSNFTGIDGFVWNYVELEWVLNFNMAYEINKRVVSEASIKFPGLEKYLVNYLEFTK